jgi:hypothetical protein
MIMGKMYPNYRLLTSKMNVRNTTHLWGKDNNFTYFAILLYFLQGEKKVNVILSMY